MRIPHCLFAILVIAATLHAQTYTDTTLYSFCGQGGADCTDGSVPWAGLIQASDGNFYGTTLGGGYGGGTVYQLTPAGVRTTIFSFDSNSSDSNGNQPNGSLIEGPDGNLYGTTSRGAAASNSSCGSNGCGTVFKVSFAGALTTIYTFQDGADGAQPLAGLTLGTNGNLYGTTSAAITSGTIFKIDSTGTFSTLFQLNGINGGQVNFPLVESLDDTYLYGMTSGGGTLSDCGGNGCGTIFRYAFNGTFNLLYTFTYGSNMLSGLTQGVDTNFYGALATGGNLSDCGGSGCGTIFKLAGISSVLTLYTFSGGATGGQPLSSFFPASDSNFYGTTISGGNTGDCASTVDTSAGCGTVFQFTPRTSKLATVHSFTGGSDGAHPFGTPVQGSDGNIYGTAIAGANLTGCTAEAGGDPFNGCGTAYKIAISPALPAPIQLTFSAPSVRVNTAVTLSWRVVNGYSATMQQCYAFAPAGAGVWTGLQPGTYSSNTGVLTGFSIITPTAVGSFTYALTCGGVESGFATMNVTGKLNASAVLVATPNPATVGQQVTLTANVTGSGSGGTPTGTANFYLGQSMLGGGSLSSGSVAVRASSNGLPVGSYVLAADYSGDLNYNAINSPNATVVLNKAPTSVTVTASPNPVTVPNVVTLTATVKRSASGASGTPTGSVTFYYGSFALSTVTLSGGSASFPSSTDGLGDGRYPITAKYTGDGSDLSSTSPACGVTLN